MPDGALAGPWSKGVPEDDVDAHFEGAGYQYDVDPNLLRAMVRQESGGNRYARSDQGAEGMAQFLPATAREMGITDTSSPRQSIYGMAKYVRQNMDKFGASDLAVAAYHGGPNAGQWGPKTADYVNRVGSIYAELGPSQRKTANDAQASVPQDAPKPWERYAPSPEAAAPSQPTGAKPWEKYQPLGSRGRQPFALPSDPKLSKKQAYQRAVDEGATPALTEAGAPLPPMQHLGETPEPTLDPGTGLPIIVPPTVTQGAPEATPGFTDADAAAIRERSGTAAVGRVGSAMAEAFRNSPDVTTPEWAADHPNAAAWLERLAGTPLADFNALWAGIVHGGYEAAKMLGAPEPAARELGAYLESAGMTGAPHVPMRGAAHGAGAPPLHEVAPEVAGTPAAMPMLTRQAEEARARMAAPPPEPPVGSGASVASNIETARQTAQEIRETRGGAEAQQTPVPAAADNIPTLTVTAPRITPEQMAAAEEAPPQAPSVPDVPRAPEPAPVPEVPEPPAAIEPPRVRTVDQIMTEDGVGRKKAEATQVEELLARGRPITQEEMEARRAGVAAPKPVEEAPPTVENAGQSGPGKSEAVASENTGAGDGLPAGRSTTPYDTVPKEPERLSSFIKRMGGVQDVGGDIRHSLGGSRFRPGLINKNGLPLDEMTQRAWQSGYMPDFADRPSINDLRDAIDDDVKGRPRYSAHDDAAVAAYEDALAKNNEIDRLASQHDIPTTGLTRDQFFDQLHEKLSIEEQARLIDEQAAAHEDAYRDLQAALHDWHNHGEPAGEPISPREMFGQSQARTLKDLENEHREQEAASTAAQQRAEGTGEPRPAAADQGAGEEGGGPRGSGSGDDGRAAAEAPPPGEVIGAGDLWSVPPIELERMLAEKREGDHAKLVRALGSEAAAKEFIRIDRKRNSQDPRRADDGAREFDAKYGTLTPEQERLIYGIGETDAAEYDIRLVLDAHGARHPDPTDAAYEAASALRSVAPKDIRAVPAGGGTGSAQAAFVRLKNAYEDMLSAGVSSSDIPRHITEALVSRGGWRHEDAAEFVGVTLESLRRDAHSAPPTDLAGRALTARQRIEQEYTAAKAAADAYFPIVQKARDDYQARRIGDAEFMAALEKQKPLTARFDAAYEAMQSLPEEKAPPAPREPTIRSDTRQDVMPGMGPSAKQAQAARDAQGRGALQTDVAQKPANEGLFAPPDSDGPVLFSFPGMLFDPAVWRRAVGALRKEADQSPYDVLREKKGISRKLAEVRAALAPTSVRGAKPMEYELRRHNAESAQALDRSVHTLQQYRDAVDRLSKDAQVAFTHAMETGEAQPTPALQALSVALRGELDAWGKKIQGLGKGYLSNAIDNYMGHVWRNSPEWSAKQSGDMLKAAQAAEAPTSGIPGQGKRPLRGSGAFLKKRSFPTQLEGIEAGLEPITYNPVDLQLIKIREMQKFYHGTVLADRLKDSGLAHWVRSTADDEGAARAAGWVQLDDSVFKPRMYAVNAEIARRERGIGDNGGPPLAETMAGQITPGSYWAPEPLARVFNNYMSQGWHGRSSIYDGIRRTNNGMNALQLGLSGFHFSFVTLDTAISKAALGLQQIAKGQPIRGVGNIIYGASIIPPVVNTVRRGAALRKAWLDPGLATPEMRKVVDYLKAGGGRVSMPEFYQSSASGAFYKHLRDVWKNPLSPVYQTAQMWRDAEGPFAKLVGVPVRTAYRLLDQINEPLMGAMVPRAKLGVFSDMAQNWMRDHPDATPEQVSAQMTKFMDSVDNRLGQLNYDNLFWKKVGKDLAFITTRSVGWNLGTVREIGGSAVDTAAFLRDAASGKRPEFTTRMAYTIAMAAVTAQIGAVMTYLFTGEPPQSLLDYYYPPTGGLTPAGQPERLNIPGYAKDVVAAWHDLPQTILNKQAPLPSAATQIWQNKDYYGGIIYDPARDAGWPQAYADYLANTQLPFSLRSFNRSTEEGGSALQKGMGFFGFQAAPKAITQPERGEAFRARDNLKAYKRRLREPGRLNIFNAPPRPEG